MSDSSAPGCCCSGATALILDARESSPWCKGEGGVGSSASGSTYVAIVAAVYGLDAGTPKLGGGNSIVGVSSDVEWREWVIDGAGNPGSAMGGVAKRGGNY